MAITPGPASLGAVFVGQLVLVVVLSPFLSEKPAAPPTTSAPAQASPVVICPAAVAAGYPGWLLIGTAIAAFLCGVGLATLLFTAAGSLVSLGAGFVCGAAVGSSATSPAAAEVLPLIDEDVQLFNGDSSADEEVGFGTRRGRPLAVEDEW